MDGAGKADLRSSAAGVEPALAKVAPSIGDSIEPGQTAFTRMPSDASASARLREIAERLQLLAREIAVVIVEQHVELALRVSDQAYVMDGGAIALQGPLVEIRRHPELARYLAP